MREDAMSGSRLVGDCPCGAPATTTVEVEWLNGRRRYRYCELCADEIVYAVEGAEILP